MKVFLINLTKYLKYQHHKKEVLLIVHCLFCKLKIYIGIKMTCWSRGLPMKSFWKCWSLLRNQHWLHHRKYYIDEQNMCCLTNWASQSSSRRASSLKSLKNKNYLLLLRNGSLVRLHSVHLYIFCDGDSTHFATSNSF